MIEACISATVDVLDASLALNCNGVYVSLALVPCSDTYASVVYAARMWASSKAGEIVVCTLEDGLVVNRIKVGGHEIATLFVPAQDDAVVEVRL